MPRQINHDKCLTWTILVEVIVSHHKQLHDNLEIGYAVPVILVFAINVGWLLAMYIALSP